MNEFSAAIGLEQLKKLNYLNNKRKEIAKRYSKEIEITMKMPYNKECSYHFYWILVKKRDEFMEKMNENNIETGIHYLPIHKMGFYKQKSNLPTTDIISKQIVSIPIHPNLTYSQVSKLIDLTNRFSQ
jgi:dTDP-4-amino-4,6-dideoxygalactose transaminase